MNFTIATIVIVKRKCRNHQRQDLHIHHCHHHILLYFEEPPSHAIFNTFKQVRIRVERKGNADQNQECKINMLFPKEHIDFYNIFYIDRKFALKCIFPRWT